jgi:von Willebrand factor type A domain
MAVSLGLGGGAAAGEKRADDSPAQPTVLQRIHIDAEGAVAVIRVERSLATCDGVPWASIGSGSGARMRSPGECMLDLALPTGAALLRVELPGMGGLIEPGNRTAAGPSAEAHYLEALEAAGHEPAAVAFEDDVRYRLRIVATGARSGRPRDHAGPAPELAYVFAAPLALEGDVAHLDFPAAPELSPPETAIALHAELGHPLVGMSVAGEAITPSAASSSTSGSGRDGVRGTARVSTRRAWRVSFTLGASRASAVDGTPLMVLASEARRRTPSGKGRRLALALGRPRILAQALPDRVLFVIDRSRSVGYGGLEAERDLAVELLRNLPPSTRFDAVLFDRTPQRLFPIARQATRQALGALSDALVPESLANGTELVGAIRFASQLLEREASDFGPRTLLVVLTDGAVGAPAAGRDPWTSPATLAATTPRAEDRAVTRPQPVAATGGGAALRLPDVLAAVVSVRPNDDPPVSADERRRLQELAAEAGLGGLESAFLVGDLAQRSSELLEGLRAGGAVFDVGLVAAGARQPIPVASQIEPGGGARTLVEDGSGARLVLEERGRGRSLPVRATPVPEAVLEALVAGAARVEPLRFVAGPGFAALWEPVRRPAETAPTTTTAESTPSATPSVDGGAANVDSLPRGFMERSVVRDALSLAYTPRARACYLSRPARTPEDRDLSGRVRIALDLVRGEVGAARILSSTLARPTIERCLRESAFALDVPRAYRNDDPVTAVLNLVFRPRTADHRETIDRTAFDRELELVIDAAGLAARPNAGGAPAVDAGPDGTR